MENINSSEKLNKVDAEEMASLMKGYIEKYNPTAKDYEEAFHVIEELQHALEEETDVKIFLMKIARVAQTSTKFVGIVLAGFADIFTTGPMSSEGALNEVHKIFDETKKKYWDAARELREYEKNSARINSA